MSAFTISFHYEYASKHNQTSIIEHTSMAFSLGRRYIRLLHLWSGPKYS